MEIATVWITVFFPCSEKIVLPCSDSGIFCMRLSHRDNHSVECKNKDEIVIAVSVRTFAPVNINADNRTVVACVRAIVKNIRLAGSIDFESAVITGVACCFSVHKVYRVQTL